VGWLTSDRSPRPGVDPERHFTIAAAEPGAVAGSDPSRHVSIRRLEPDEAGTWAEVLVRASALAPSDGAAWRDLAAPLARGAHTALYVAEAADGRALGAASLHTHRGVGHLRATAVLPEARGQGIQRALIRARAAAAAELGCQLVAASAVVGSASERNLLACGLRPLAIYGQYRFDPEA
jgi:GNAT superfamily N-acetyltransferase